MTLQRFTLAGVLLSTAACMTVRPVPSFTQYVPQHNPPLVWVTYTDNSIVPVLQPKISGDSLVGTWQGLSEPVSIPLGQVKLVQARQRDKGRTTWLIAGLSVLTAAGVYAIVQATGKSAPPCTYGYGVSDPC
jgi:hypothetical protein